MRNEHLIVLANGNFNDPVAAAVVTRIDAFESIYIQGQLPEQPYASRKGRLRHDTIDAFESIYIHGQLPEQPHCFTRRGG